MDFNKEREKLIEKLRAFGYLKDNRIEKAFLKVKRENFIPKEFKKYAYEDSPLPIGAGQTISAPHMYAIMLNLSELRKEDKVLEIGTGSGYGAALISELVGKEGKVITVENIKELFERAKENLRNYENVKVICGDGSLGYEKEKPYDRILVTCASPHIPGPLIEQLKENGRIVIPVGSEYSQNLVLIEKKENKLIEKNHGPVVFVPMKGKYGF